MIRKIIQLRGNPLLTIRRRIHLRCSSSTASSDLSSVLIREIEEEEDNLAKMDEYYDEDLSVLKRQFSKVEMNDYDPVIILEKNSSNGKTVKVRCNIEDEHEEIHYLDISISDRHNQTLGLRVEICENEINVENFSINTTDKMFDPSEKDNLYNGPLFSELEDDLQDGIMLYLEEHGIDSNFAEVMQNVIRVKEQEEYIHFLDKLKGFVEN